MKKRIITILLALTLLVCLSISVFAESQLWNITDDAGLLSDEEYTQLESYAESVSETYGVGVYVITIDNYEDYYDTPYETAWQFYHAYTLGEGDDRDGIILLLSMDNLPVRELCLRSQSRLCLRRARAFSSSTTGTSTISAMTTGQAASTTLSLAARTSLQKQPPVSPSAAARPVPFFSSPSARWSSR